MDSAENSKHLPLGKTVAYPSKYDPNLLFRIERPTRSEFYTKFGFDRWVSYEFTWLAPSGCPKCCVLEIIVPASTNFIVESKSLKLYLSGFALESYKSENEVIETIRKDLAKILECQTLKIRAVGLENTQSLQIAALTADLIDDQIIDCAQFKDPSAKILQVSTKSCEQTVYSNSFRSLCPVTGQPDYATVVINYAGTQIEKASLLRYLVSYRNHSGFHETCCEHIFEDILASCTPTNLTVACFFTRRGGIDINPVRSTRELAATEYIWRCARQ